MTKRGKRKISLLLDSESIEALLDYSFEHNLSLNQVADVAVSQWREQQKIDPFKEGLKSVEVSDLKLILTDIHSELELVRKKLKRLSL